MTLMMFALAFACTPLSIADVPIGTGFTYQGRIKQGGTLVTTAVDLRFTLWNALASGTQIGSSIIINNITPDKGLFTVPRPATNDPLLDFGVDAFTGSARWLQLEVRSPSNPGAGGTGFSAPLAPRQPLSAAPYAISGGGWSLNAAGESYFTGGNVGIGTNDPTSLLHVNGAVTANTLTTIGNVLCNGQLFATGNFNVSDQAGNLIVRRSSQPNRFMYLGYDAGNYAYIQSIDIGIEFRPLVLQPIQGGVGIGVLPQPGRLIDVAGGAYCNGTAWLPTSDRNMKENFAPIDNMDILSRLSTVPLSTWNFIHEDDAIHHLGPMAQDFHAAFGLNGTDEKSLNPLDTTGVAFASIQALHSLVQDQKQDLARQRDMNDQQGRVIAQQQQQINDLTERLRAIEERLGRRDGQDQGQEQQSSPRRQGQRQ